MAVAADDWQNLKEVDSFMCPVQALIISIRSTFIFLKEAS
jgi:hypothetical protein